MTQSDIPIFDDDNTSEDRDSLVEIEGYEVEMKSKGNINKCKENSETDENKIENKENSKNKENKID